MEPLNDMEMEFVKLACQGNKGEEIAKQLFRSHWTVTGYRESVIKKTRSRNMVEAVAKLYDTGILKPNYFYDQSANSAMDKVESGDRN